MMHRIETTGLPVLLLLLFVLGAGGCGRPRPESEVTNLILIVVDTLRPDHLGCYGHEAIRTPMIDDLARHGTVFEQAVTPVPVTSPAFSSLLTSTFPPTHGVRDNGLYSLSEEMLTLAEVLEGKGFRTAAFLGSAVMDSVYGLGQGFTTYDDHFEGLYTTNNPEYLPLAEEIRMTRRRAEVVSRNALGWIRKNKRSRFFVMLHYFDPHAYYDPPPPFDSLYAGNAYDGEIAYTDYQIEFLMRGIGTFNIPGRTLIVLTADHGEGLMEHNEGQHGLLIYDSTLRVPLIFNCPGVCPAGLRIPDQVCLVDVAPSILSLVGVEMPEAFQGADLRPFFEGRTPDGVGEMYCETYRPRLSYGWSDLAGIRKDGWKYIRAPKPELYHLVEDPGETSNLAGSGLPIEESLAKRLDELLSSFPTDERYRAPETPRDEATRERLESLGYLAGMRDTPEIEAEVLPNPKDEMEAFNLRQLASHKTRVAWNLLEAGNSEDALAALRRAVELEPQSPVRHANLGTAYARLERIPEAIGAFEEALRIDPGYDVAHLGLARAHAFGGDADAVLRAYRAALAASPGLEEAVLGIVDLETARGRPERARVVLEEALRGDPDNTTFLSHLIQVLRDTGNAEESIVHLERLAALQPLNPDPPFYLAHTLARMGKPDEALRWYGRAVELDPAAVDAYYNIACIHARMNRKDEAIDWLAKAVEHGFTDLSYMKTDPDLESLHAESRFQSLF